MTTGSQPLTPQAASPVVDPALGDAVEEGYDVGAIGSPTTGPNRYTVHVPTETTRLSLGQKSPRWNTDLGITGYTDSHVHFETKTNDKTVVSLGGPATTADVTGLGGTPPVSTHGYSMVTEGNAWHDALLQHYLLSQTADMSLRTAGAGKRAVIQADHGKVDVNGGQQVNVSGGGVSIAADELEVEDVGYGDSWEAKRPHSSAAGATRIVVAVAGAVSALVTFVSNKVRTKYAEGNFAGSPMGWADKNKWKINGALLALAVNSVRSLAMAKTSPEKCVKLAAKDDLAAMAGGDISVFGVMGATLGSAGWTTVSAGMSASLKATAFGGVGGAFASMKGYRKVEMASDYGNVGVAAEHEILLEGKRDAIAGGDKVAHIASPASNGKALFGGKEKLWFGSCGRRLRHPARRRGGRDGQGVERRQDERRQDRGRPRAPHREERDHRGEDQVLVAEARRQPGHLPDQEQAGALHGLERPRHHQRREDPAQVREAT